MVRLFFPLLAFASLASAAEVKQFPGIKEPVFQSLIARPAEMALFWLGFVSTADVKTAFFIDDLKIQRSN